MGWTEAEAQSGVGGGAGASITATLTTTQAGDTVVALVQAAGTFSFSVNCANVASWQVGYLSAAGMAAMIYVGTAVATAPTTVEIDAASDGVSTMAMLLYRFEGLSPAFDTSGTQLSVYGIESPTGTTALAGPLTTTGSDDLVLMCVAGSAIGSAAPGLPFGWSGVNNGTFAGGYYVQPTAGSLAGYGWNLTSGAAVAVTIALLGTPAFPTGYTLPTEGTAIFRTPIVQDESPYLPDSPPSQVRLYRHYANRWRGVNVWRRNNGTYVQDTPTNQEADQTSPAAAFTDDMVGPYEIIGQTDTNVNYPWNPYPGAGPEPGPGYSGIGPNPNPGQFVYGTNWDGTTFTEQLNPYMVTWFQPGADNVITHAEAVALTAAGYGDDIS